MFIKLTSSSKVLWSSIVVPNRLPVLCYSGWLFSFYRSVFQYSNGFIPFTKGVSADEWSGD